MLSIRPTRRKDCLTSMTHDLIDPLVALTELSRTRLNDSTLDDVLDRVVTLARRAVPGADEVSLTLVSDAGPYTAACTGETALKLDQQQYERGDGPCLRAAAGQGVETGPGSVLSVGLPILEDLAGSLNIYGRPPHTFDDDAITQARTFARHAAVAVANAHLYHNAVALARQLQAAMESRAVIEQAKGIVMAQRRCAADEAFGFLTKVSQDNNRKVRDVAAALVAGTAENSRTGQG
jgi:GAF domain-containing protein